MWLINSAEKEDLEEIYELEKELFLEDRWSYPQILKEFNNKFSQIWVIKEENKIVGYLIFREFKPEIEILKIGIKKEYQRKGLGTKLLQELIIFCKKKA